MVKQMTRYIDEWGWSSSLQTWFLRKHVHSSLHLLDAEQLDLTRLEANPQS